MIADTNKAEQALEVLPYCPVGLKGFLIHLLRGIHQEWQNGVTTNVLCDILFGVISSHLGTVVDVLLEDIAQHVRVDVLAAGCQAVVQVPVPLVEEGKKTLESSHSNLLLG